MITLKYKDLRIRFNEPISYIIYWEAANSPGSIRIVVQFQGFEKQTVTVVRLGQSESAISEADEAIQNAYNSFEAV